MNNILVLINTKKIYIINTEQSIDLYSTKYIQKYCILLNLNSKIMNSL